MKLSHVPWLVGILLVLGGWGWYFGKHPQVQEFIKTLDKTEPEAPLKSIADQEQALSEIEDKISELMQLIHYGDFNEFTAYIRTLSHEGKILELAQLEALMAQYIEVINKQRILRGKPPIHPKPSHTHGDY